MANLDIKNPHDKFFRELLGQPELAADFLQHYLPPEVVARLDLTRLELTHDSFVDADLQEHLSDLLYHVGLRENERAARLYFLFEHKSYSDGNKRRTKGNSHYRHLFRSWCITAPLNGKLPAASAS